MPAKKKKDESLEESLASSATKKGLSGADKRQYIGGAITNMRKKGELPARAGAKKAAPKTKGEALYERLQRGETVSVRSPRGQSFFEVKTRKFAGVTGYVISQNGKVVKGHNGAIMPRSEAIEWLNGLKEKSEKKAAKPKLAPKAPEKPKEEEKNYSVHMDVLPGKTGPGMKAHREYNNLSEQEAKNMVNQYGSIVFMKRIVVYKGGKKLRGWIWSAKDHRLVEMKR